LQAEVAHELVKRGTKVTGERELALAA